MSLGDKTVLLRNPWKGETLRINRPAAVKAASLGTHFALGFVTGCVRVFGSCAPFGVAMAARSGGGLGGLAVRPWCGGRVSCLRLARVGAAVYGGARARVYNGLSPA